MDTLTELHYNYCQSCSDGKEVFCESYDIAKVGDKGVIEITEHLPQGEGDRCYYTVIYADKKERIFNPCKAIFSIEEKSVSQKLKEIWQQ